MEVNLTARHAKLLVESTRDAIKSAQENSPNLKFQLSFSLVVEPGEVTDSSLLSWLDKLGGAIGKFDQGHPMRLVLNIPLVSDTQGEILKSIQSKFETVMQLEAPAKPKIVGAGGEAIG